MTTTRAPKQWSLTKTETITSFEAWRQNLQYTLSLDSNFAPFLGDTVTWLKKSQGPLRGFIDDDDDIPAARRRSAQQKCTHLELMLGQIANYCPVISRNSIVKNSTSINSIWQSIRMHYGFQSTGAHFIDYNNIRLEHDERPEDLFQRLMSFVEDNLLIANGSITHHGESITTDEELTPSLENMIVLTWLRLIHSDLPNLVKQRYGTELRSRTLASLKPEISQALDSLLDELRTAADSKVLRTAVSRYRFSSPRDSNRPPTPSRLTPTRRPKSCPLCKEAGRVEQQHYLSKCPYLPPEDRLYFTKTRMTTTCEEEEDSYNSETFLPEFHDIQKNSPPSARAISRRVSTRRSPQLNAFYKQHPVKLTLDTGAETSMIKASLTRSLGLTIEKTSQQALQADGTTPLAVVGEVHICLSRSKKKLALDALVVEDLDVDVLAGIPFLITNDISVRPATQQLTIQGSETIQYLTDEKNNAQTHIIRAATSYVLRSSTPTTVIWPGDYLEIDVPPELGTDSTIAVEPRCDVAQPKRPLTNNKLWPQPQVLESVGSKVRLTNTSDEPYTVRRHDHICWARPTTPVEPATMPKPALASPTSETKPTSPFSSNVSVDPDKLLSDTTRNQFKQALYKYDNIFKPDIPGYNGAAGPIEAQVNMGPVEPPQRKGRLPQYSRGQLIELQEKFDELEKEGVFQKPEDIGVAVEYLNPSFLVKKPSGGHRLVTAFEDVGRYSKPQPSLMPDVDSTLRTIAPWKYLIKSDLSRAFYQIPLSRASRKYCGVATPFRGIRVYCRSAMGMPGSETALEEMMCRVLGDLIQEGYVTKIADDLYCGGTTPEDLLSTWTKVLVQLDKCNLRLSPTKTVICPKSTTILGWVWSQGKLSASPHRVAVLSSCPPPTTVKSMRSFIGSYKVLSRVLPDCSSLIDPLECSISGLQSQDKLTLDESLLHKFHVAQQALTSTKAITLPRPSDTLWIVTDGSVTKCGLGATLYVSRDKHLHLAGFFSAKLRKHQVTWLPCEIEALSIAAAVKHFSPYIIQSEKRTCVLTDSKPCVQAIDKLARGEFSASPRVTSFLTTVSRYQVTLQHLAGTANLPSDFASRNAANCHEPTCQVCSFIHEAEDSVVRNVSVQEIIDNTKSLPFTTRSAWREIQNQCPDLRRVHAHLKQGTRPSKKLTNIKDIKRYLNLASISKDGLLVVRRNQPFATTTEAIIVPRSVLDGLLTALHVRLNHPSRHQLQTVLQRHFYALDMNSALERISSTCHTCASLQKFPSALVSQTSEDPPDVVGISFAADVIKRQRQLILLLRECSTSYTSTCLIPDEKYDTLRDALTRLVVELHPIDGPRAIVRVDPAPSFVSLSNNDGLKHLNVWLDIGRVKNVNKNPVAEKAVQELEEEFLRQEPGGGQVTSTSLAIATARLNSRLRHQGLSARELWTQRNQFTGDQLPISDYHAILAQHRQRSTNHPYSEKCKNKHSSTSYHPQIHVGDVVYLISDRNKLRARDRYIVTEVNDPWCHIKKFSGSQLRSTSYKVKLCECYVIPALNPLPRLRQDNNDDCEDCEDLPTADPPSPAHEISPPSPPEELTRPYNAGPVISPIPTYHDNAFEEDPNEDIETTEKDPSAAEATTSAAPTLDTSQETPSRPHRERKPPDYLKDYVLY